MKSISFYISFIGVLVCGTVFSLTRNTLFLVCSGVFLLIVLMIRPVRIGNKAGLLTTKKVSLRWLLTVLFVVCVAGLSLFENYSENGRISVSDIVVAIAIVLISLLLIAGIERGIIQYPFGSGKFKKIGRIYRDEEIDLSKEKPETKKEHRRENNQGS